MSNAIWLAPLLRSLRAVSLLVVCLPICASGVSDPLRRQPSWGFSVSPPDAKPGAIVRRVEAGSSAEMAGLRSGDTILEMNGKLLTDGASYRAVTRGVRGGDKISLRVSRGDKTISITFEVPPLPREAIPGAQVLYDSLVTDRGHRLRTIVTRPESARGRLPAILLVQWLSCDSIESPLGANDGWSKTLLGLAERSGFVLMRVERPGIGDSEGPDCSECDLETDMAGYRAALAALKRYDFVDTDNLFLLGASIGGALAPVLAQDQPLRGLIVSGGFAKTWGEHMLEHERKRLELSGKSPAEIDEAMRAFIDFYSLYLNNRMAPGEVIRSKPALASFWYDEPGGQYGRPAVYYQQVQKLNVGAAWARISAPVLILYGEYDWIMSRGDQDLIVDIVNSRHPGNARLSVYPKMDHNLDIYESLEKAFKGEGRTFDARVVDLIIDWLKATKRP